MPARLRFRLVLAAAASAVIVSFALLPVVASAAPPSLGELTYQSCIGDTGSSDCDLGEAAGLDEPSGVAVSPDGKSVYTVSSVSGTIALFTRSGFGALTPGGCIQDTGGTVCSGLGGNAPGLDGARDVAVSPDGKSVYVASNDSDAIAAFSREPSGALTPGGCIQSTGGTDCIGAGGNAAGLNGARSVAVSRDGKNVYVASHDSSAVVVFSRAPSGALTPGGCIQNTGGTDCTGAGGTTAGLFGASGVAVSRDGTSVYVTSSIGNAIVTFSRAANGGLTPGGCIQDTGGTDCNGAGGNAAGLTGATDVAVSPDNKSVYVASDVAGTVVLFSRAANGALTPGGCIQNTGGTDCANAGGNAPGLGGAAGVAVSPDGKNVYVASIFSNAVATFGRAASGALTPGGCVDTGGNECAGKGPGLTGANSVALSPNGSSVYVTGSVSHALVHLAREVAPVCGSRSRPIAHATPTKIALPCGDANGDPITIKIVSGPKHGKLGPIDQYGQSVTYTPKASYSGPDSFTFSASDGGGDVASLPATIKVQVAPATVASALSVAPNTFEPATGGPSVTAAATTGAQVRWRLSHAARTVFTVARARGGRRVGGKCVKGTKQNKSAPRCTRYKKVKGSFGVNRAKGKNSLHFTGRLAGKALGKGRYRLTATPLDAGHAGVAARTTFKVG